MNLTRTDRGVVFLPNGALRINRVQTDDGGVYECIATSIAGVATKAMSLVVQGMSVQISWVQLDFFAGLISNSICEKSNHLVSTATC